MPLRKSNPLSTWTVPTLFKATLISVAVPAPLLVKVPLLVSWAATAIDVVVREDVGVVGGVEGTVVGDVRGGIARATLCHVKGPPLKFAVPLLISVWPLLPYSPRYLLLPPLMVSVPVTVVVAGARQRAPRPIKLIVDRQCIARNGGERATGKCDAARGGRHIEVRRAAADRRRSGHVVRAIDSGRTTEELDVARAAERGARVERVTAAKI